MKHSVKCLASVAYTNAAEGKQISLIGIHISELATVI
jgi:hypothetical protein